MYFLSEAGSGGVKSSFQVNTNLNRVRQFHDTLIVKFQSSYSEGSQCMDITRTLTGFSQLKNLTRE